jgi:hypothetical protein
MRADQAVLLQCHIIGLTAIKYRKVGLTGMYPSRMLASLLGSYLHFEVRSGSGGDFLASFEDCASAEVSHANN